MKININGNEIALKYSFRAMIIFEKITGTTFSGNGITEILIYFYATILGSDKNNSITFDEFMDWLDENPDMINEFSKWLSKVIDRNAYINKNAEKANQEQDPKNV